MPLARELDRLELFLRNGDAVWVVNYEGALDVDALFRSYSELCRRHPVLLARIQPHKFGCTLHVPAENNPDFVVLHGDEECLQHAAVQNLDDTKSVARIVVIETTETAGYVLNVMSHSIADGANLFAMQNELWQVYTRIFNGLAVAPKIGASLPRSPCELLEERWGRGTTSAYPLSDPAYEELREFQGFLPRIVLGPDETNRMLQAARSHRISLRSFMCGGIVSLLRSYRKGASRVPMQCHSVLDLRRVVTPSVSPTETTNFLAFQHANVLVAKNAKPVEIGREVSSQLDKFSVGDPLLPEAPYLEDPALQTDVNNIGMLKPLDSPSGLKLKDRRPLVPWRPDARQSRYHFYTEGKHMTIMYNFPRTWSGSQQNEHSNELKCVLKEMCVE